MFDEYNIYRKSDASSIEDEKSRNRKVTDFIQQGLPILNKVGNHYYYLKGGCLIAFSEDYDPTPLSTPKPEKHRGLMVKVFTERGPDVPGVVRELETMVGVDAVKVEDIKEVRF